MKNKKKYLSFDDLRVAYAPKDDVIQLTSGDPELAASGWRLVLQQHTPAERTLRAKLEAAGLLRLPTTQFPEVASYPAVSAHPWHEFPLGVNKRGEEVVLDLRKAPHAWLVGATGTGKSVVISALLAHVAQTIERWHVTGVDLKRVELARYRGMPLLGENFTLANTMAQTIEAVDQLHALMFERYEQMEEHGFRYVDLIDAGRAKAHLLLFDEAWVAFSPDQNSGEKSAENWDQRRNHLLQKVLELARLGRVAGIHLIVGTQRPDTEVYPGELRAQLENRILLGRSDEQRALTVLDYAPRETAVYPRGRGWVNLAGAREQVQFYFPAQNTLWEILLAKSA